MKVFLLALLLLVCSLTQAATYYISPTGNDNTGTGTITNPWRTLFKATSTVIASGDIIHVSPGYLYRNPNFQFKSWGKY